MSYKRLEHINTGRSQSSGSSLGCSLLDRKLKGSMWKLEIWLIKGSSAALLKACSPAEFFRSHLKVSEKYQPESWNFGSVLAQRRLCGLFHIAKTPVWVSNSAPDWMGCLALGWPLQGTQEVSTCSVQEWLQKEPNVKACYITLCLHT